MSTIHLLQLGPHILGAYSTEAFATDALDTWCGEFQKRFDRTASLAELPTILHLKIDEDPGPPSKVVGKMEN